MPLLRAWRRVLLDLLMRISNLPALYARQCLGDELQQYYLDLS